MPADEHITPNTKSSPLSDLGIHAAGDPNAAEPNPDSLDGGNNEGYSRTRAPDDLSSPRNPENDPISDLPDIDTGADAGDEDEDPNYRTAQKGRLVFRPGELNNAGEDKEYFPPDKDHKFDAPKDANNHALTPDVEVTPDNTIKPIK